MAEIRLIIAGGRDFDNYHLLKHAVGGIMQRVGFKNTEIVSGTAKGADSLGEQFAKEFGILVKRFPADWDKHGKRAGYIRNEQMAQYATHCICFWDGKSKGTESMIELAKRNGLHTRVVRY